MFNHLRLASATPACSAVLLAASLILAGAPTALGAEMTESVLPNGMRVIMRPVHTNPVVCSAVLVRAGVAWEPEGMSGASHFLEHLLFNGTETRNQDQLYADVDRIGAFNNATTRDDHTLFLLLAPKEHLDTALEIQADMLLHSTLPPDKFEKEKGIVLEEMGRDANDPGHLADVFFDARLHSGSPYARPVLGTVESIRGLTRDAVLDYYRERYVPRRMVMLLAGDFDPDTVLARIRKHFLDEDTDVEPDRALPAVSIPFVAEPKVAHHKLEAGRTYLRAAFPAPAEGDPDALAFALLVKMLGAGGSSPLESVLKGGAEPLVFDYALHHDTTGGAGALVLSATLTGARPAEHVVRLAADTMLHAVRTRAIDPEHLRLLREAELTEEVTLAEQVHYYAMFRAHRFLQLSASRVHDEATRDQSVRIEAFGQLADRYLVPLRAIATVSGPDEQDGLLTPINAVGRTAEPEPREPDGLTPEAIVLDNGLTLSVRTEPAAAVFAVHLIARNRSALEPEDRPGLADLVHQLLLRGTLARDAAGLDDELRGRGINVKFSDDPRLPFDDYRTTPAYSFLIIETRTERATEALRLLAEILQTPRFDADEIGKTAAAMQDIARRKLESSSATSLQSFRRLVAPDHPWSRPVAGTVESLTDVRREDVVHMYERLLAPENLILTIRGGGSRDSMVRRAKQIFGGRGPGGGWTTKRSDASPKRSPTSLVSPPAPTREARRAEHALGKRQSHLRLGAVIEVPEADRPALLVARLVLSDRLQMDLREAQGLAYSVGASISPLGAGRDLFSVAMGTAPDNLERAEQEIRRVTAELREGPVPRDELNRVVAARKGRILMRRLPRQNQALYDGLRLLYGAPTEGNLEILAAMGRVTPEQVVQAAVRYIDPTTWTVAVVR
jgi:predicted Zn-dependent peptidase